MKRLFSPLTVRLVLNLAWLAVVWGMTGCATSPESENLSSRPWNTPKSWESGLPSGMFEGR